MKIKITRGAGGVGFPYGILLPANEYFVRTNVGQMFEATRTNINYYRLSNGYRVHVYNAMELPDTALQPPEDDTLAPLDLSQLGAVLEAMHDALTSDPKPFTGGGGEVGGGGASGGWDNDSSSADASSSSSSTGSE